MIVDLSAELLAKLIFLLAISHSTGSIEQKYGRTMEMQGLICILKIMSI